MNILRKVFWSITTKKIFKITCPSNELISSLKSKNFLINSKIEFLPDAIIDMEKFRNLKIQELKNIQKEIFFINRKVDKAKKL